MNPQSQGLMRAITGPVILITIGVLFSIERFTGGRISFGETWPVLMIVIGALRLLGGRRLKTVAKYYAPPFNPQATYGASPYSSGAYSNTPPPPPAGGYDPQAPPPPAAPGERR